MNRLLVSSFVLIFILGLSVGVFFNGPKTSGNAVSSEEGSGVDYTYTKAICNSNKCVDVLVNCSGGKVSEIKPVSDLVEFDGNWSDFRNQSGVECSDNKN